MAKRNVSATLVLGIDGGGTKTLAWLAQLDAAGIPQIIGRGRAGSSNRIAIGLETALANLAAATAAASSDAKLPERTIANAVLAIAGSGTAEVQRQLLDFVQLKLQIQSARVVHDGEAVLQAGTPDGWGIALVVGTGAVAWGKNPAGSAQVVGGWGYWFGDEGSAYWLGQAALRAISHADDGRGEDSLLTAAVLGKLQAAAPRQMLLALSHQGEVRHGIADLAPIVCEVAGQGDAVAQRIVTQAAEHWVQHIRTAAEKLALGDTFPLAIAGGVLCGSEFARGVLREQLAAAALNATAIEFVEQPVRGCVKLAAADAQR